MRKDFKFDARADYYDTEFEGKLSEKFYSLVIENVTVFDGVRILDVGCGTGTILQRLSKQCHIYGAGIDVEEKMLKHARKKCLTWIFVAVHVIRHRLRMQVLMYLLLAWPTTIFPIKRDLQKKRTD